MDMKKYAGSDFIKLESVEDGPVQKTVCRVDDGKFDKPEITFELHILEDAPWGDLKGKPLNDAQLARRLRQYGVRSKISQGLRQR